MGRTCDGIKVVLLGFTARIEQKGYVKWALIDV